MGSRQFGIQEGRLALQRRLENGARPIKDLRHETGTKFLKTGPNCGSWANLWQFLPGFEWVSAEAVETQAPAPAPPPLAAKPPEQDPLAELLVYCDPRCHDL